MIKTKPYPQKAILSIWVLLLSMVINCSAQDTTSVSRDYLAAVRTDRMTREIELSKAQSDQIYQVLITRVRAIDAIVNETNTDNSKVVLVNDATDEKVKSILTKGQYDLFIELRKVLALQKQIYRQQHPTAFSSIQDTYYDY